MLMATAPGAGPGWLITLGNRVIGDCGAYSWPNQSGEVEIGYGVAASYRGRGYATEATRAMCTWLFTEAGATLIMATGVLADNMASRRILEKLGFTRTEQSDADVSYALRRTDERALRQVD